MAINVKGDMKKAAVVAVLLWGMVCGATAEEVVLQRPCRRGTPNPESVTRRAPAMANGENPYVGNRRQLVVMAAFLDKDFEEDHEATLTTWNKIFNAEDYAEDKYAGSVHDYFLAQSYGLLNLTFDLMLVELPDGRQKYRSTDDDDEFSQYMVDDIVDVLQTQDIDWSLYDWDGDGFVNQLLIIYAGEGMNASSDSNTIWPHQWWLSHHLNLETADPNDYRSYRTVARGEKEYYIDSYCCVQEVVRYGGLKSSFGTLCHEYSHCFSLPDFYYNSGAQVVGNWDIMDNGCYSDAGFHPCGYSAHERMIMGWLTPVELTGQVTVTDMPALCDEPRAYLVRNEGAEDEYYIIENRQKRGWDEKLPGSGIVIFHVDYDKALWEEPLGMPNTGSKKRYHIFAANNDSKVWSNGGWAYPYIVKDSKGRESVANDCLTNTSAPAATLNNANADGERLMSKPITQMSVDGNGLASFVFEDSGNGIEAYPYPLPEGKGTWFDFAGRKLDGVPAAPGLYIKDGKKVIVK